MTFSSGTSTAASDRCQTFSEFVPVSLILYICPSDMYHHHISILHKSLQDMFALQFSEKHIRTVG